MDPNIQKEEDFFDIGSYENIGTESINSNIPTINFNNGEDIVLIDSFKSRTNYKNDEYSEKDVKKKSIGLPPKNFKVLISSFFPPLYFEHNRLFDNMLNELSENMCVLDLEYSNDFEQLSYNTMLGKYKPNSIDIVGNNSKTYDQSDSDDCLLYNKIFVNNIINQNSDNVAVLNISNMVGNTIIDVDNIETLKDCIIILSTNLKSNNIKLPIDNTNNCELGIIDTAVLSGSNITLTLKNKLLNTHKNNIIDAEMIAFIAFQTLNVLEDISINNATLNIYNVKIDATKMSFINIGDYIAIDWGVERTVVLSTNIPYKLKIENDTIFEKRYTTGVYEVLSIDLENSYIRIQNPFIEYPTGSKIILLKNHLQNKSDLASNFISTQPYLVNNQWYTRIFYRGSKSNIGSHYNSNYVKNNIFPNISNKFVQGGMSLFSKNSSDTVFISGMKGIKIPFINLESNNEQLLGNNGFPEFFSMPMDDNYYKMEPPIDTDTYNVDSKSSPRILNFKGEFRSKINNINEFSQFTNETKIKDFAKFEWISDYNKNYEFPYITVKGFYLGYGGTLEERFNKDTINTIVNNDSGFLVKKINQINNKFFVFVQRSSINNDIFSLSNLINNYNIVNQSNRKDFFDYETNLKLFDEVLEENQSDYENYISIYGINGRMVKKKVENPYNLNPDKYVYLAIPNLNHIKSLQNELIPSESFSKILLPGDGNTTLYNTFIAGTKIFTKNLFNNLSELEIAFITNDGFLFDFNGSEHSFTIEITEIIDKFEIINPKFGNIEI